MAIENIIVPDIGGAEGVEVIELNVKVGDHINAEDAIVTLESDKATMGVPAPFAGEIKALKVAIGDKVSEGAVLATVSTATSSEAKKTEETSPEPPSPKTNEKNSEQKSAEPAQAKQVQAASAVSTVTVPDIGGAEGVEVIEISVQKGDEVSEDQALVTLESDKATMEVPSPFAGKVEEVSVKVGDKVSEGSVIAKLLSAEKTSAVAPPESASSESAKKSAQSTDQSETKSSVSSTPVPASQAISELEQTAQASAIDSSLHASPVVRRLASEFGINLHAITPTGPKGRIVKVDVQNYIKTVLANNSGSATTVSGTGLPAAPSVDFSKFGAVESKPLNKIKKLTGKFLSRNWLLVPHVTQFNDADITDLEAFRQEQKAIAAKQGLKLTPLVFIMKAVVKALQQFPDFNASLSANGEELILKKYFHLGVAVDTPDGLVVPVVKNVDQKGIFDLAKELGEISAKAREGKLMPGDMQGACFTISSLGGIGGTAFTPIVNMPEVAILGVSKSQIKPVYTGKEFEPRLMLPLSLSYDHRVIDGAEGARFIMYLSSLLADLRLLLL